MNGIASRRLLAVTASIFLAILVALWLVSLRESGPGATHREGIVILSAGDSITAATYPQRLQETLDRNGVKALVINRGVNGHTSGEYLRDLQREDILRATDPDFILVQLGTNDLRIDGDHTTTDRFIENMTLLIGRMRAHVNSRGNHPRILLSTIPPIVLTVPFLFDETSVRRVNEEINPAIHQLAKRWDLILVDNYQLFVQRPNLLPEIHPNEAGYRAIANNWLDALSPLLGLDSPAKSGIQKSAFSSPFSEPSGKIVFQSNRDGNNEIYVMEPDGSGLARMTHHDAADGYPVWSPDGKKIAYESNRDGIYQLYLMDQNGKNTVRVTHDHFNNRFPAWSPDGKRIAFESKRDNGQQVYAINLESGKVTKLTSGWRKSGLPNWSPDGRKIAFTAKKLLGWGVYAQDLVTHQAIALDTKGGSCRPHWAPDGKKIAYVSQMADGKGDIWIMNADGSGKRRLTTNSATYDYYPAWSPDGKKIAYASSLDKRRGRWEIYIIDATGGDPVRITHHKGQTVQDKYPDWHSN